MEDYMEGRNAELLGAGQIKGRAAFDLYCRQPGTRIARIMDAIEAGMDCLSLGVTYGVDFETVMVCMKAYRSYYGAPAKKRDETAMSGTDMALTSNVRNAQEQICEAGRRQRAELSGTGTERLRLEKRRGKPAKQGNANKNAEPEVNGHDQIGGGKAVSGGAMKRRCDESEETVNERSCVGIAQSGGDQARQSEEAAEHRKDLSGCGEATNCNEPKRRSKELNGIGIAEIAIDTAWISNALHRSGGCDEQVCEASNRRSNDGAAEAVSRMATTRHSAAALTGEANRQSTDLNCGEMKRQGKDGTCADEQRGNEAEHCPDQRFVEKAGTCDGLKRQSSDTERGDEATITDESNMQSRDPNCAKTNLNCDAIVCEQENRQSRERSGVVMSWQSEANHSEEKNRSGDEPIGLGQQWQSAESSCTEKALICDEPNRISSEPGSMASIPDLTECVRVMLANGAGVSRIAKRLGVTRTQVTMIAARIERGKRDAALQRAEA